MAIKIIEKNKMKKEEDKVRVEREIEILMDLDHSSIVRLYEVQEIDGKIFLVMEFVTGGELFDYIVTHERVKEKEAKQFFAEILDGVSYCHSRGVVHRDLKPENLLLTAERKIKIADFGLSNKFDAQPLHTACGSPAYAAPEVISGKDYVAEPVDVWSLGVILFALLCGYLPFQGKNLSVMYDKIKTANFKCPDSMSSDAKDLVKKMLTVNVDKRITLKEARKHAWMQGAKDVDGGNDLLARPLNGEILDLMEKLNFKREEVEYCISRKIRNSVWATYQLLVQRRSRGPIEIVRRTRKSTIVPPVLPPIVEDGAGGDVDEDGNAIPPGRERAGDKKQERKTAGHAAPNEIVEEGSTPKATPCIDDAVPAGVGTQDVPAVRKRSISVETHSKQSAIHSAIPGLGAPPLLNFTRGGAAPTTPQSASAARGGGVVPAVGGVETNPTGAVRSRGVSMGSAKDAQTLFGAPPKSDLEKGPREARGTFSAETTSSKDPAVIMKDMKAVLAANHIEVVEEQEFFLFCRTTTLEAAQQVTFEAEVCRLPNLASMFAVLLKRRSGDTWDYKKICGKLIEQMAL